MEYIKEPLTTCSVIKMKRLSLKINGMHCISCERLLNEMIGELPGVQSAKFSFEKGEGMVSYDTTLVDERKIIQEITTNGYTAKKAAN